MKNAIIGQSGGPTSVINSSLWGVIKGLRLRKDVHTVYGMRYGIQGFLEDRICDLSTWGNMDFLNEVTGSFLGSCRYKVKEDEIIIKQIFDKLEAYNIGYFYYIGGNDSMDTIKVLAAYAKKIYSSIQFIGIPKTIDNDLMGTYTSPGYATSATYIITAIMGNLYDVYSYDIPSITIVETMGRDTGWLAASSSYLNTTIKECVDYILVPEVLFDEERFFRHLKQKLQTKKHIFIVVAEGLKDMQGKYLSRPNQPKDAFGNVSRAGVGQYLKQRIMQTFAIKVNVNELGLVQRSNVQVESRFDKKLAFDQGNYATTLKHSGVMVALLQKDNSFIINEIAIDQCANQIRYLKEEYIDIDNFTITTSFVTYIKPLIDVDTSVLKQYFIIRRDI